MNFKNKLTLRNHGFILESTQKKLGDTTFLIAGCGSIGGSAVELLVRTGARKFILADPDTYDHTNLNRQSAGFNDVGRNKANLTREKILWVYPDCEVEIYEEGINELNLESILKKADIIVDGIDVTTISGWNAKYSLHESAKKRMLPVISGYDMDATQYTIFHDYTDEYEEIFKGRISKNQVQKLDPLDSCLLLITPENMPLGIFKELYRIREKEKNFISQLGISANLFGVVAVSMIIQILNGETIKKEVYVDMWDVLDVYSKKDKSSLELYRNNIKKEVNMMYETTA